MTVISKGMIIYHRTHLFLFQISGHMHMSWDHMVLKALKALSHDAVFLATCNAILLSRDVN